MKYYVWVNRENNLHYQHMMLGPYDTIDECKNVILEEKVGEYRILIQSDDAAVFYKTEETIYNIFVEVLSNDQLNEDHQFNIELEARKKQAVAEYAQRWEIQQKETILRKEKQEKELYEKLKLKYE